MCIRRYGVCAGTDRQAIKFFFCERVRCGRVIAKLRRGETNFLQCFRGKHSLSTALPLNKKKKKKKAIEFFKTSVPLARDTVPYPIKIQSLLGAFAKLQKATASFIMSVSPTVCPSGRQGTTQIPGADSH